jgi:hypothetical protein
VCKTRCAFKRSVPLSRAREVGSRGANDGSAPECDLRERAGGPGARRAWPWVSEEGLAAERKGEGSLSLTGGPGHVLLYFVGKTILYNVPASLALSYGSFLC